MTQHRAPAPGAAVRNSRWAIWRCFTMEMVTRCGDGLGSTVYDSPYRPLQGVEGGRHRDPARGSAVRDGPYGWCGARSPLGVVPRHGVGAGGRCMPSTVPMTHPTRSPLNPAGGASYRGLPAGSAIRDALCGCSGAGSMYRVAPRRGVGAGSRCNTVFMTHPTATHPSDGWKEVIS